MLTFAIEIDKEIDKKVYILLFSMQRRNPYSDLGLVIALSVFICILVKCLLFGFTWVSIIWLILACIYFFVSWRYPSQSKVVRHSTTCFLLLSVIAMTGILLFDQNARPVMHAFEGTGDTLQDAVIVEEEPIAPIYVPQPEDTLVSDTLLPDETIDSLSYDEVPEPLSPDTLTTQP